MERVRLDVLDRPDLSTELSLERRYEIGDDVVLDETPLGDDVVLDETPLRVVERFEAGLIDGTDRVVLHCLVEPR